MLPLGLRGQRLPWAGVTTRDHTGLGICPCSDEEKGKPGLARKSEKAKF